MNVKTEMSWQKTPAHLRFADSLQNVRTVVRTSVPSLDAEAQMFYTCSWHGKAQHLPCFRLRTESLAVLTKIFVDKEISSLSALRLHPEKSVKAFRSGPLQWLPLTPILEERERMGAPKGNCDALKHGLYAKHFSPAEQAELRRMPPDDYQHEIYMMRVAVKNLFEIQMRLHEKVESVLNSKEPIDVEALTKITNSLSLAVTALNTTARTYALFNGADTSLNDSFDEALNSLSVFLDDRYLIETEAEQQAEILVLPEETGKE